jgi:hypothetical protein
VKQHECPQSLNFCYILVSNCRIWCIFLEFFDLLPCCFCGVDVLIKVLPYRIVHPVVLVVIVLVGFSEVLLITETTSIDIVTANGEQGVIFPPTSVEFSVDSQEVLNHIFCLGIIGLACEASILRILVQQIMT